MWPGAGAREGEEGWPWPPELTLGGSPMGEVLPGSPFYRCGN